MLSGPVLLTLEGGPVPPIVGVAACLGWFGLPAMAAHPVHPKWLTGVLTALGAACWFASGLVTMIDFVWGG
jgi:hypothetical protein